MIGSLILLPKEVSVIGLIALILAGIYEFRHGYIGRIGIAGNAFLLWQIFYNTWSILPNWFQWYLNLGTIFAIISIISYLSIFLPIPYIKLPKEFYQIGFYFYGSISIVIAIWGLFFMGIPIV
jgi:hypothetical protein